MATESGRSRMRLLWVKGSTSQIYFLDEEFKVWKLYHAPKTRDEEEEAQTITDELGWVPTTSPVSFGPVGSPSGAANVFPDTALSSPGSMSDVAGSASAGAGFCAGFQPSSSGGITGGTHELV